VELDESRRDNDLLRTQISRVMSLWIS
jgi:hypothetical protein